MPRLFHPKHFVPSISEPLHVIYQVSCEAIQIFPIKVVVQFREMKHLFFAMLYYWATETLWRARPITKFQCMKRVLRTARISSMSMSLMSCFVNRRRKMVSFELDKDVEKGVYSLQWALLTLESLWLSSSIGVWNPKVWGSLPHGNSEFFLCPMLVTRPKIILLYC